ncbi:hypothetical protein IFM89_002548 [Coptis chinensis]|uniref:Uncharacterized protein n=1 Tax=Coptis chinensis TaxID=261450 RepID=A0A835HIT3_9MAGN|nr:hypothetical protein IFM89_002548 [Coptis chinensis]
MQSLDGSSPTKVHVSSTENPEVASFFESIEAAHSSHEISSSIAMKLGVQAPAAQIDSQAKYGGWPGEMELYTHPRSPHKDYREKIWDQAAGFIVVSVSVVLTCDSVPQYGSHVSSVGGWDMI